MHELPFILMHLIVYCSFYCPNGKYNKHDSMQLTHASFETQLSIALDYKYYFKIWSVDFVPVGEYAEV